MEAETQHRPRMRAQRKNGAGHRAAIVLLALAVCCGGALLFLRLQDKHTAELRESIIYSDTFHPGIAVGGVTVGGMTYAQARDALAAAQAAEFADMGFTLKCNGSSYSTDPSYFVVASDAEEQLRSAFALARNGSLDELTAELAQIAEGTDFKVTYTVTPVREKFETMIQSISAVVDTAPTDATATVKAIPIDPDTQATAAFNLGLDENGSATDAAGNVVHDLRDLRFDFHEGTPGYGVDHDALLQAIASRTAAQDWGDVEVTLGAIEPTVTIETLKETLVLRSSAVTKYSGSSDRVFNVKKAVGLIYGTVLQPGEQFSHNGKLGDRTEQGGWKLAPAVIDGGANHEDQAGGGVCQTSTTLYQAVLKGDFQVNNRRGHSTKSSYAAGGLDCTIADTTTGNIDFLWTNNTDAPIYIFMWLNTSTRRCNAEIYGKPFDGDFDAIEISSELVETIAPTANVYTESQTLTAPYWQLGNAAKEGYSYDSFKTYMKDGAEVNKVKVDNTVYRMHPARYYVYPGWAGEPLDEMYKLPYDKDE